MGCDIVQVQLDWTCFGFSVVYSLIVSASILYLAPACRLSMRDAWGQVLPTASTGVSPPRTYGRLTSHGRRWSRFQQPYAGAQLAHQESTMYRSSNRDMIHTRPSSRRVTGQHSLHSWLQPGSWIFLVKHLIHKTQVQYGD